VIREAAPARERFDSSTASAFMRRT
jgi:hypothetical protein